MDSFLGIDLGTQSVKVVAYDEQGNFQAVAQREYPILTPEPGFAEQDPEIWWEKTREAIIEITSAQPEIRVKGLSFSGQMHGLVILGEDLRPLYPAIIWADQRSKEESKYIREHLGDKLVTVCGSNIFTGFMASSLLWVKENLPEVYQKARWVLLPKDYLKIKLGFSPSSDVADASSTLLFDINLRNWSFDIISQLELNPSLFPPVFESTHPLGPLSQKMKDELNLQGEATVVAGAGDQPCAALGNGITDPGELLLTIGTGGQIFSLLDKPAVDSQLRVHTFCHALPGQWHLLGATLSAGLSLSWFKKSVLDSSEFQFDFQKLDEEARAVPPSAEGLLFLPYLIGERTPHMDPYARGAFLNLHLTHSRAHLLRAIMEGVAFALKDSVGVFQELKVNPNRVIFSGGGSKSSLWRLILASVLNQALFTTQTKEEAATGACILSMLGTETFSSAEEAARQIVKHKNPTLPRREWVGAYQETFSKFKEAYFCLAPIFPR
ncbi:MAG: xylulokinase [Candidatus Atribacteria bacterium]|nr:xylulokinase [Candidatus Atribacteria bacterium]